MSEPDNREHHEAAVGQLKDLRKENSRLKRKLYDALAANAVLQDTIGNLKSKMPVTWSKRDALAGPGIVLQIKNFSGNPLPVKVSFTSPTFKTAKSFDYVLDPPATVSAREIGHLEGWQGAPGDQVQITSEGFEPISITL